MDKKIKIYDTTLRDGAQTFGISFSLEDKIKITKALDELGIHYIEGGWPGSNPKDINFFEKMKKIKLSNAKLTAFSSTKFKRKKVEEDKIISDLLAAETPVVTIFGKSWDLHVNKALKCSLDENLELIHQTIDYLKPRVDEIIFDAEHFFDGYKKNRDYAIKTLKTATEAGCDSIALCDTNGGTLQSELIEIIEAVKKEVEIPLGIHTHNDSELAVANSITAVEHGIEIVQGTINGLGERCGNANICSIIPILSIKQKYFTIGKDKISNLKNISHLVSELSNQSHMKNLPFVGDHAFAHKGGIHVSAVLKDSSTYEHINPESIGNRRFISVSELSGKSNIHKKLKDLDIKYDQNSSTINRILKEVKDLEAIGYSFEGAQASFELLCKSVTQELRKYFTLYGYRVMIWKNSDDSSWAEATIKAGIPEDIQKYRGISEPMEHTSADGHGPVEALDKALRKVLERFYPQLKEVKLTDYKVRILDEEKGTKAVTRVLIHSMDRENSWTTVGVSSNIIDASWQALSDSLIYKLMKDDEKLFFRSGKQFQNERKEAL